MNRKIIPKLTKESHVKMKKGVCQSDSPAKNSPSGTPSTEATEKADMTNPIALPRLASGTTSPIIAKIKAEVNPPNNPDKILAKSRIP